MNTKTLFATLALTLTVAMPAAAQEQSADDCRQGGLIAMLFCRGFASILKNIEQVNSPAEATKAIEELNALTNAVEPRCPQSSPTPYVAGGHGNWGTRGFSAKRWCN